MPDTIHWLGLKRIDRFLSMSDMKHDALTLAGHRHRRARADPAGAHSRRRLCRDRREEGRRLLLDRRCAGEGRERRGQAFAGKVLIA